ncbi:two-component system response regulator [Sphingobacteriaceae bacterium]|nr:two-component system response regulator [Sphingobacteriaceae bacterium]
MEELKNNSHIIIADDDLDDQYIIKEVIEKMNVKHEFISVYNGLELIHLLKGTGKTGEKIIPGLIIMDLNMPLLDGLGALTQIKANEDLNHIPIYILSTSRFDYDRQRALELGANDFFSKPYKFEELKEIIKEIYTKTFTES